MNQAPTYRFRPGESPLFTDVTRTAEGLQFTLRPHHDGTEVVHLFNDYLQKLGGSPAPTIAHQPDRGVIDITPLPPMIAALLLRQLPYITDSYEQVPPDDGRMANWLKRVQATGDVQKSSELSSGDAAIAALGLSAASRDASKAASIRFQELQAAARGKSK